MPRWQGSSGQVPALHDRHSPAACEPRTSSGQQQAVRAARTAAGSCQVPCNPHQRQVDHCCIPRKDIWSWQDLRLGRRCEGACAGSN